LELETIINSLTRSALEGGLRAGSVTVCLAASLVLGLGVAAVYRAACRAEAGGAGGTGPGAGGAGRRNFVVTLALLPAVVQIIVMLVNGNIGAGVAVAGAFSLVRFRSIPGTSRDITAIFFAMALGFVTGMGYIAYGFLFLAVVGGASLALPGLLFPRAAGGERLLRITIPESLDYDGLFTEVLAAHTDAAELDQVRTTNMGSLYELTYRVRLKAADPPKAFVDALRALNGNLNISISRERGGAAEL